MTGMMFYIHEEKQYCETCMGELHMPTCLHCKKKIMEEYLVSFNSKYHRQCFQCKECSVPISKPGFFTFYLCSI
jgi:hypothetical protein